jgi:hypothetical protein
MGFAALLAASVRTDHADTIAVAAKNTSIPFTVVECRFFIE